MPSEVAFIADASTVVVKETLVKEGVVLVNSSVDMDSFCVLTFVVVKSVEVSFCDSGVVIIASLLIVVVRNVSVIAAVTVLFEPVVGLGIDCGVAETFSGSVSVGAKETVAVPVSVSNGASVMCDTELLVIGIVAFIIGKL